MTLKQWFLTAFIVVGLGMIMGAGVFFSCSGRSYYEPWECLNEHAHAIESVRRKEPGKVWTCRCEKKMSDGLRAGRAQPAKCKCYCIGQEYELIVEEAQ